MYPVWDKKRKTNTIIVDVSVYDIWNVHLCKGSSVRNVDPRFCQNVLLPREYMFLLGGNIMPGTEKL